MIPGSSSLVGYSFLNNHALGTQDCQHHGDMNNAVQDVVHTREVYTSVDNINELNVLNPREI